MRFIQYSSYSGGIAVSSEYARAGSGDIFLCLSDYDPLEYGNTLQRFFEESG